MVVVLGAPRDAAPWTTTSRDRGTPRDVLAGVLCQHGIIGAGSREGGDITTVQKSIVASFSVAVFGLLTMSSAAFFQIEGGWCVIVALSALSVALLLFAGFRPSEVSFSCRQINKLRSSLHALFGRLRKKPRESASGNR